MIEQLPNWINYFFVFICLLTLVIFYKANGKPTKLLIVIAVYATLQSVLAYYDFYKAYNSFPPRLIFVVLPFIAMLIYGLLPRQVNSIIKTRNLVTSTYLHSIRILVELILYHLFLQKMVPELMTFQGRNFDILTGLTAPIIAFLYQQKKIGNKLLLIWNFVGLSLVLFILINAILSAETPLQQFAFEQPNRAVLYFPFILLPSIIVPIVIYTHLTDILSLLKKLKNENSFPGRNS
jgi:hypothetical protein